MWGSSKGVAGWGCSSLRDALELWAGTSWSGLTSEALNNRPNSLPLTPACLQHMAAQLQALQAQLRVQGGLAAMLEAELVEVRVGGVDSAGVVAGL